MASKSNHIKLWKKAEELVSAIAASLPQITLEGTNILLPNIQKTALDLQEAIEVAKEEEPTSQDIQHLSRNIRGKTARLHTFINVARDMGYLSEKRAEAILSDIREILSYTAEARGHIRELAIA